MKPLTPEHLRYLGHFFLPRDRGPRGERFGWGGAAMALDPSAKLLYVSGHPQFDKSRDLIQRWPVAAVNVLLTTILTFNYFDIIYVLTRGGPLNSTAIFPTRIYEVGFGQFRFGEAAAYGTISVVVLVLLVAAMMLFRPRNASGDRHG